MSASESSKHKCLVCGRVFPTGQGIIVKLGDFTLEFHSNKCFAKFAKALLERIPPDEAKTYVKRVKEDFEELLIQKSKLKAKRI